jgi:[acyl-carrier-protein] S-malonyltransferase
LTPYKTSFIFPAFVSEYSGNETEILLKNSQEFDDLLNNASVHLGIDLTAFDIKQNNFQDQELNTQYISYIFSCAASAVLKKNKIMPEYLSGYSMGIYSALYCGGAISFTDGLNLIRQAFQLIKEKTEKLETGIASIIGLSLQDVQSMIANKKGITIANTNGIYSYMISGLKPEINRAIDEAKKEGALHASLMNVSCPYHTSLLNEAALQFGNYLQKQIAVNDSKYKLVSGIDQRIFNERDEIIRELVDNINTKINWMKTMEKMLELNISEFVECGAGISLYKIGKFIKGNFTIYPLTSIDKLLMK